MGRAMVLRFVRYGTARRTSRKKGGLRLRGKIIYSGVVLLEVGVKRTHS